MIFSLFTRFAGFAGHPRSSMIGAFLYVVGICLPCASHAETTNYSGATLVTALPKTISTPGTYYLNQDFAVNMSSGKCFDIETSNVTIDLNGHTITNTNGTANTAFVLYSSNFANITVRNGTISGFYYGIYAGPNSATTSYGHLCENVSVIKDTVFGIGLSGVGCRIYHCRAILLGGSTATNSAVYNFMLGGTGNSIEDCDVASNTSSGTSIGVDVSGTDDFVVNNRLSGLTYGVLSEGGGTGVCKYRDNLTSNISGAAYTGGTNAGNNN